MIDRLGREDFSEDKIDEVKYIFLKFFPHHPEDWRKIKGLRFSKGLPSSLYKDGPVLGDSFEKQGIMYTFRVKKNAVLTMEVMDYIFQEVDKKCEKDPNCSYW